MISDVVFVYSRFRQLRSNKPIILPLDTNLKEIETNGNFIADYFTNLKAFETLQTSCYQMHLSIARNIIIIWDDAVSKTLTEKGILEQCQKLSDDFFKRATSVERHRPYLKYVLENVERARKKLTV